VSAREGGSFDEVISRLRAGDQCAAAEVFDRFASRLIALARTRLHSRLRAKVDPEDVLQSVFRSFFVRQAEDKFTLRDWDSLWGVLVVITLRKCGRQVEWYGAKRRDVNQEMRLAGDAEDSTGTDWEAIAREPSPAEATMLAETVEHLMRGLNDRQQTITMLRLQGHTVREISQHVERTEQTVRRVLREVKDRLERAGLGDSAAP